MDNPTPIPTKTLLLAYLQQQLDRADLRFQAGTFLQAGRPEIHKAERDMLELFYGFVGAIEE